MCLFSFQVLNDYIAMGLFPQSLLSGETTLRDVSPELDVDNGDDGAQELEDKMQDVNIENGDTG